MKGLLLKGTIAITSLALLLILWIVTARSLSLALDHIHTVPIETRPVAHLDFDDGIGAPVWVNDLPMSTAGPDNQPFPIAIELDRSRQLIVRTGSRAIVLGKADSSGQRIEPTAGDRARFQIDRSVLSWPTPLELNFMTGQSPSWRRHLYYRLTWEKPDGAGLEMVWRYEQPYNDGWASGFMTRTGTTGLIRVAIRP